MIKVIRFFLKSFIAIITMIVILSQMLVFELHFDFVSSINRKAYNFYAGEIINCEKYDDYYMVSVHLVGQRHYFQLVVNTNQVSDLEDRLSLGERVEFACSSNNRQVFIGNEEQWPHNSYKCFSLTTKDEKIINFEEMLLKERVKVFGQRLFECVIISLTILVSFKLIKGINKIIYVK